jgi:E3 ubiquitin-protein ligase HUWE1
LEALPFEIREEILRQDQNDGGTIERGNETESRMSSQLLANLDMQLRQQLFPENEDFLSSMPPVFDTASFRQRLQNTLPTRSLGAAGKKELKKPASLRLEPIQLLEKQALMNLVRLIFVPDNTTNTSLHRILINLSQNNKSRSDIAILLLSILAEGSADLASVDRNFSQMTLKSGKAKPSAKVIQNASPTDSQGTFGFVEAVPNLVAQRCLEALSQLVAFNPLFIDYLLSENDQLSLIKMSRTPSKKSKGKEKEKNVIICQYPVIILLRLLERPYFLENSSLLEQLMTLLSNVFKFFKSKNTKGEEADSNPASLTPTESTSKPVMHEAGAAGEVMKSKKPVAQKYPLLPAHNLKSLVYALRDGVCSSKTFQSALSVIQNVSKVKEFKDLVAIELSSSSQKLGELMESELQELAKSMKHTEAGMPVEPKILSVFSSALSQQAKLLRLLKAVDFVFFKGTTSETDVSAQSSPNSKKDASEDTSKRSEAAALYDQLQFLSLWTQLGEILQTINDRSDFMHIATVLLPLIESFMVVSKPYVVRKKQTTGFSHKSLLSVSRQNSSVELGSYNLFVHFTDQHRKILNTLVRNNPSLMGGSFSLLVDNPKILEFDNKKTYFTQQLHKKKNNDAYGSIQVNVRRQYVFEDSYHQLQGRSGDEMKNSKLNVRFYEEEGVDAGGVTREWYTVLARQMFNPDYALFKPSAADKVTYQPNRSSGINPDHLSYFKFVGRIIGKAIYDGRLLDCYFTRSFYKLMLGIDVDYKDIEAIDPSYHKSLEWILNNEITDVLDLNFVLEVDEFGRQRTVELIPNGKNTPVTDENKHEYVHLIAQQRLVVAIKDQINAFLTGFQEIIPKDLIKIFNEQELELLISGLPDIDIDDW